MSKSYSSVRLEVTSSCNLNCAYCHNAQHSNGKNDMTTAEIITLIRNLKSEYDIKKVLLTGGEPLVKKDICLIIHELTKLGIKADMVTNGTLMTEELLEKLENAGLKRIRMSIDEVTDTTTVRGTSSPNDLWNKARMVVEKSGIELCIHTVASPYNVNALYDVYQKVLEIGAKRWRVFDIGYQGDFVQNCKGANLTSYYCDLIRSTKHILSDYLSNTKKDVLDIEINNVFRTAFLDMCEEDYVTLNFDELYNSRLNISPCDYVTSHQISVRSDGIGTLCQYFHNPIYNFRSTNFDIQKANDSITEYEEFVLKMKDLEYCSRCKYAMLCNSGCRARAKFLTGNIFDADPVACYLHPMVHTEIMSMLPKHVYDIYCRHIRQDGLEPKYSAKDLRLFLMEKGYHA